jgi:hypothetical protein
MKPPKGGVTIKINNYFTPPTEFEFVPPVLPHSTIATLSKWSQLIGSIFQPKSRGISLLYNRQVGTVTKVKQNSFNAPQRIIAQ